MLTTLSKHKVRSEQAINIIGLIGVLIVLSILVALVIPRRPRRTDSARPMAARSDIAKLTAVLRQYKADTGAYPNAANGWQDWRIQPPGVTNWHGPYVEDVLVDPWGHEFVYEYPGKHTSAGYPYDVYSLGPGPSNGILGNWEIPSLKP